MQKVVGSSPIIRFTKAPLSGVFVFLGAAELAFCKRNCKRKARDRWFGSQVWRNPRLGLQGSASRAAVAVGGRADAGAVDAPAPVERIGH